MVAGCHDQVYSETSAMKAGKRVYLDVCCLNRPFDNQAQDRVRLETEAVKSILFRIGKGEWTGSNSEAILLEIRKIADPDRQLDVGLLASQMSQFVTVEEQDRQRAIDLQKLGFRGMDALHVACAEKGRVEVFLTTDDSLLRTARKNARLLRVQVANPLTWLEEVSRP